RRHDRPRPHPGARRSDSKARQQRRAGRAAHVLSRQLRRLAQALHFVGRPGPHHGCRCTARGAAILRNRETHAGSHRRARGSRPMTRRWALLWLLAPLAFPQAPPRPSYKNLAYPPLRPIQIPKVDTFTLSNGMKVYLLEDHELPTINGTALVRTGNL